ncbi:hypothetical protein KAT92_03695 [Candidatus Babeliales bacterium]|nr:hypothetical protein [Candidatus Babeliales bacterium]
MPLTQLKELTGYEVSFVPRGANGKKRFLVTKEDGELSMDKLLQQILKEGLKDEESIDKIAKNLDLNEEEKTVLKAVMKMVGSEASPMTKEKLIEALSADVEKEESPEDKEKALKEEEAKAKLEKEEKEKKEKEEAAAAVNKENKGGSMPGKVPVMKEDGSWDLSGVDGSIRPSLEVICKSNEQLTKTISIQKSINETLADKLKSSEDARVLKEFEAKAEAMGHLGESATDLAKVLKSVYDADPENAAAVEAILQTASTKIEKSMLFEETGSNGAGGDGGSAWGKIEKHAEAITKADSKISNADAIDLVLKNHPELYAEYEQEKRRA